MTNFLPNSRAVMNDETIRVKLCRFCAGSTTVSNTEQIEHHCFAASITCTGCDSVVSTAYGEPTEEEALRAVIKLYNTTPRYKYKGADELPNLPLKPAAPGDGASDFERGRHDGQVEMWSECINFMQALKDDNQQIFEEGLCESNAALFAIHRFFEMRRMYAKSQLENQALKAEIDELKRLHQC